MKIPKLKTEKIKRFLKKTPRVLGGHGFLTFSGLLLIALILGGLIFYKYSFLAGEEKPEVLGKPLEFKEETYQEVLKVWQRKEREFQEIDLKKYQDPFGEVKKELPSPALEEVQETSETEFYIISQGETLWELAKKYLGSGERWREIKNESGQPFTESSAEVIPIGQRLIIPLK